MKKITQKLLLGVCALFGFSLLSSIIKKSELLALTHLPLFGTMPNVDSRSQNDDKDWLFAPQEEHQYKVNHESIRIDETPKTGCPTIHHRTCLRCKTYNVRGKCGYTFIEDDTTE